MITLNESTKKVEDEKNSLLFDSEHQVDEEIPVYNNAPPRKNTFQKKVEWSDMPDRCIVANHPDHQLPDNSIQTTKYNMFNFIPKNLMEQFSKLANVYFLIIGALQTIKPISTSNGKPVLYAPLALILAISAIKDLVEDLKRRRDDKRENFGKTQKLTENGFVECRWMDLKVGDIVKVQNNEYIPADLLLLKSSETNGISYVETKNLDGETNLKPRFVDKTLVNYFENEKDLYKKRITVNYERPNPYLYTFRGNIKLQNGKELPLTNNNFLLRACSLRSPYAIGMVCYTGHDTKIMLNSVSARGKSSKLERIMNTQIILVFTMQNILCFLIAIYSTIWNSIHHDTLNNYMHYQEKDAENSTLVYFFMKYGNWLVIFTNFVPISLLVTLEMVKFIQASIVMDDPKMVDDVNHTSAVIQTSRLMEELGQINYIFSDKTGTLTCNIMEFKKLCLLGESYGDDRTYEGFKNHPKVTNVDFLDHNFFQALSSPEHVQHKLAHEFLLLLSTCHSINIDESSGTRQYSASSPDELALVNFAKYCGYEYLSKNEKDEIFLSVNGSSKKYKLLHMLEFDSDRKRMSVILETENKEVILYCKGADSIILDRMSKEANPHIQQIQDQVENYANQGLRTLLVAKRDLSRDMYEQWAEEYIRASSAIKDREESMAKLQEEIEVELVILGATAIEDKLQDQVGDTISCLKEAGMKVWVLTGDKTETAINIGFSCKLLDTTQEIFIVDVQTQEDLLSKLAEVEEGVRKRVERNAPYALVITGKSLIFSNHGPSANEISDRLYKIFSKANAVVACRVSPKQKRDIVELVKGKVPTAVTLAIGDGANDVNMITAAHVGVGIKGLEGYQAARASDFAIGEFKLLRRLLLYYGRESYRKNSLLVLYNFFKNQILILPQFWYGLMNGFSGTSLYEPTIFQLYNICYASLPIVAFAVTDKEFNGSFLEKNPRYYKPGLEDNFFNMRLFWRWFSAGSVQAIVIAVTAFGLLCNTAVNQEGYTLGFFSAGMMAFNSLIICANLKILLFSNTISFLNLFLVFGSILFYVMNFAVLDDYTWTGNYKEFGRIYGTWNFYFGTIIMIVLTTFLDLAISRFRYTETLSQDKVMEKQIRRQSMKFSYAKMSESANQESEFRKFSIEGPQRTDKMMGASRVL